MPVVLQALQHVDARRRSKRVQSVYRRTVADLPLAGRQLILRFRVRRFRCSARRCPRVIFAERFPKLVAAYGRRTLGQRAALELIAVALDGSAGARLATQLGSPVSRATLLRVVRCADVPARFGRPYESVLRIHFTFPLVIAAPSGAVAEKIERYIPARLVAATATSIVAGAPADAITFYARLASLVGCHA